MRVVDGCKWVMYFRWWGPPQRDTIASSGVGVTYQPWPGLTSTWLRGEGRYVVLAQSVTVTFHSRRQHSPLPPSVIRTDAPLLVSLIQYLTQVFCPAVVSGATIMVYNSLSCMLLGGDVSALYGLSFSVPCSTPRTSDDGHSLF